MAKVRLTKKNFTKYLSEHLESTGFENIMLNAFTGGKAEDVLQMLPDEQPVIIDTKFVVAVGQLTKLEETGDVVFQVMFNCNDPKMQNMWIKGEEYRTFLCAWFCMDEETYDDAAVIDVASGTMKWKHPFGVYAAQVKAAREACAHVDDPYMIDVLSHFEEELLAADKLKSANELLTRHGKETKE